MELQFSMSIHAQYIKDCWGYKMREITPNTNCGSIETYCVLKKNAANPSRDREIQNRLLQLLNGEPITAEINVSTSGIANHHILEIPNTLSLQLFSKKLDIKTELQNFVPSPANLWNSRGDNGKATCLITLRRSIASIKINDGEIYPFTISGEPPLEILKTWLENPGKYYLSEFGKFIITMPKNMEEAVDIYNRERITIFPTSEQIMLDPISYTDNPNEIVSNFARAVVSDCVDSYTCMGKTL